ncbi:MAG TPA: hypothetical protein VG603_13150 [Chitinophagales bacterium]|nr:hypothetical protein [Chitinophagales bacterium]
MSYQLRIKEALDHADENIAWLSRFSDSKLEKRLDIVQAQIAIASQNKQPEALQLLHIWERQIIEARILKYSQQPQLDELTEIEQGVAEMEAFDEMLEKRNKVIAPKVQEQKTVTPPVEEKPAIEITQMKLF